MAVVFRARDERLNRLVALKIMAPGLAADLAFRHRFIRESQVAATVDDPNIIPVYDAGEADGVLFIAMRLVSGGDVKSIVALEGPLPPARAEWIVSAIASALDSAHGQGLVHRDVKPHNMLLEARPGRPDHVYLSDFGLSKLSIGTSGLTGTGQFLGTVDYCSPEQIQGKQVDGRTDQYALGCTAYEMLTGEPPFARDHAMAVMWAHITENPPPVNSSLTAVRPDADEVFARVLAKDPANRFPNCQLFADALRQALGIQPYAVSSARIDRPAIALAEAAAIDQPKISAPEFVPAQARQSSDGAQDSGPASTARRGRRRRKQAVAAANATAGELSHPATMVVDSESVPPAIAENLGSDPGSQRASSLETLTARPPHPSHPSHPSHQTTNLRDFQELAKTIVPPFGPGEPSAPVDPGLPPPPSRPRRRALAVLLGAAGVVVLAAGGFGVLFLGSPKAKQPQRSVSQAFSPQQVRAGVLAVRHWKLSGAGGSLLTEQVTVSNSTATTQAITFSEPVPTSIAQNLSAVHFTPPVLHLANSGRVAVWTLSLPPHQHRQFGYWVRVPAHGATMARLTTWADDLRALAKSLTPEPAVKSQLHSLKITPSRLKLKVGSAAKLMVSGVLSDGKSAPPNYLTGATWKAAKPAIATVNAFGKVIGKSAGATEITVHIGTVTSSINVVVTALPVPHPTSSAPAYTSPPPAYTPPPAPPPTTSNPKPTPTYTASPLARSPVRHAQTARCTVGQENAQNMVHAPDMDIAKYFGFTSKCIVQ
jgi:serine/threonine-protein kinase